MRESIVVFFVTLWLGVRLLLTLLQELLFHFVKLRVLRVQQLLPLLQETHLDSGSAPVMTGVKKRRPGWAAL